jgi:hypothetical protein
LCAAVSLYSSPLMLVLNAGFADRSHRVVSLVLWNTLYNRPLSLALALMRRLD